METAADKIFRYHESTKHNFRRYARSSGVLDWHNQPDPFRVYRGAERFHLPLLEKDLPVGQMALYRRADTPARTVEKASVGAFFELSMGLSAWKTMGKSRWPLRMNPSSGNLHPTEAHLVWPGTDDLPPGVYHYHPFYHMLEQRMVLPEALANAIPQAFCNGAFLVGISSIFWRESWKYGERAFRYCLLDTGHVLAAMSFSGSLLGWRLTPLVNLSRQTMEAVLGFDRTMWPELGDEDPEVLCVVHPADSSVPHELPPEMIRDFSGIPATGAPNPLSGNPVKWEIIYEAAAATETPAKTGELGHLPDRPFIEAPPSPFSAAEIIRKRRSASAYHAGEYIDRKVFFGILDKTLPRRNCSPFDLGTAAPPSVDLLLFVHRVRGVDPGLYYFVRTAGEATHVKSLTTPDLRWAPVDIRLPLFLLKPGDFRKKAAAVSCHQDIAGDGVFSVGMIAKFRSVVSADPHRYRQLFWESGMIGQVLYLEAEAAGIRGTGIGCFFDDPVHEFLGLVDDRYQSLYHFTMGVPIDDGRLGSLPPYDHLAGDLRAAGTTV